MTKSKKGGLGKGLEALFVDNNSNNENESQKLTLRISEIEPNKEQPRKNFDNQALSELAESIKEHGLLQPIVVRMMSDGVYQIVAGERRWRACRMAGVFEVPVVIKELSDTQAMEISLIENLQREDLSIIEEAQGYKALLEQYNMTQESIARRVGKSRPVISNAIRILGLPQEVIELVSQNKVSAGHAKALLSLPDEETIIATAQKIALGGVSVREVESMGRQTEKKKSHPAPPSTAVRSGHQYKEIEISLQNLLGKKVKVKMFENHGVLEIEFNDLNDLKYYAGQLSKENIVQEEMVKC